MKEHNKQSPRNWKDALVLLLDEKELQEAKTAYDILGSIAIIEVPKSLKKKAKLIARTLLDVNPKLKTILMKAGQHSGTFRTQKLKYLAGEKTKVCEYKENGTRLRFNVEKTYFSARLSTERKRIAEQVKDNEDVLVMFSGAAPYVCVIGRNTKAKTITGVEINPKAHKYALENVKLNKLKNSFLIRKNVHKLKNKDFEKISAPVVFDRIAMPLPKTADEFLNDTFKFSKKGTIIHLYDFLHESEFKEVEQKIFVAAKKANINVKILKFTKCGQYSPRKYRVCVDFVVE